MYRCKACREYFENPKRIFTTYERYLGVSSDFDSLTAYEYEACPYCYNENFEEEGEDNMERTIIDLNETDMTFEEINSLEDYIWKNDKLIPAEMIEGE